jgi:predicted enzyme related to lactoylglutathione lyase
MNPVSYFEIPVQDMDRAMRFYFAVFGYAFERATLHGNDMAFFPHAEGGSGASGALAKGDSYVPGRSGARIYFSVPDMKATLAKAIEAGGVVLFPETEAGSFGLVAEIEDLEGNCIALHAAPGAGANAGTSTSTSTSTKA